MKSLPAALFFMLILLFPLGLFSQTISPHGRLKITPDGHFLQYEDGQPFFWLGDTGWELFHKLQKKEIEKYLENRAAKGFTVIQAVILDENPDYYGDRSFYENDPAKPNEKYFEFVDWVVEKAAQHNLIMALLPTWGDKVTAIRSAKPPLFNETNAYAYGLFLGKRYRDYPNIVWVAGGDNPAFVDSADWRPVFRAMINGLRTGMEGKALITYHPWGENSSTVYWRNEQTLDFNMMQSGHRTHDLPVWEWIKRDRAYSPAKPVLDGEPNYEDHPVNWDKKNGYFRAYDVRRQIYRSVFAGAFGVTYGHQAIWQFYGPEDKNPIAYPDRHWTEALDRPGAFQAGFLKKLIASRKITDRIPDQTILVDSPGEKENYIVAFHGADSSYLMVYLPMGRKITVSTSAIKGKKIIAWWFNPQNDRATEIGSFKNKNRITFTPSLTGAGNDWVLVLDDAAAKYRPPGT